MTVIDTYLLLRAFCDELARCGMEHACTCPGSRNTPILLSLAREPRIQTWSHVDERCAGFFALGAAKASGVPVAVTCTSGTAAANLAPAVIEAHEARVPLIVLTADRPPELRDVGAGQTIDQIKLYGDAAKWFFEVGVDEATEANLRWIRTLACRAFFTAATGRAGPVHLNFPLREPLVLEQPLPGDDTGRPDQRPYVFLVPQPSGAFTGGAPPSGRIVAVAGGGPHARATGEPLARAAERARIPLLADPLSGSRHSAAAIARYDLLLRDPEFAAAHRPDFVFRVGDLPTSKPLRAWLAGLDVPQVALDPDALWHDPDPAVEIRIQASFESLLNPDDPGGAITTEPGWLDSWRSADEAASAAIAQALGDRISEPAVAAKLGEWLSPDTTLFVASSMPIRDVELFFPSGTALPRVLSNRGANGIDGTVSAAFGAATVSDGPVVLLIGDVALAHDIGGLLAARRLGIPLTIVVLNNDGGGIFHFLPVAGQSDHFEEHVATPHGLDFAKAAELYGCDHVAPATLGELKAAIVASTETNGVTIVEFGTEREQNLELHRHIASSVLSRRATEAAPGA
jgi:2-succinyl-5-enolpyruvyl-6-hydroxy-3-cyclohexene-1-carboxylate synthase